MIREVKPIAERAKSKMKRYVVFITMGLAILLVVLAGGSALGQEVQGHGSAHILATQSEPSYVWGETNNGTVPMSYSSVNGNYTISGSYITGTGTNSTINYFQNVTVLTNVTVNDLNEYGANAFYDNLQANTGNVTVILGYGTFGSNDSYSFTPLEQQTVKANTSAAVNLTFKLTPAQLTENQSSDLMLQYHISNASVSFAAGGYVIGNKSPGPWYTTGLNLAYVIGGIAMIMVALGGMIWIDIDLQWIKERAPTPKRRRPAHRGGRR